MPDLVPNVSLVEVDPGDGSGATQPAQGIALVDMTQLQPVYLDVTVTPNGYRLAYATDHDKVQAKGVTVNSAKAGQPISVLSGGSLTVGCLLAPGHQYVVSPNTGRVCDLEDLVVGDYVWYLFFADDYNHAVMNVNNQLVLVQLPAATTTTTTTTTT